MTKIIKDPTDTVTDTDQLFLSDDPATIAAYLKLRKEAIKNASSIEEDKPSAPYNFADFVTDMNMTDFNDDYQIRATLESQAQLLGTAFNYLMVEGDWKNLAFILRTQKSMRDTMELMQRYPPLTYWDVENQRMKQEMIKTDAPMD